MLKPVGRYDIAHIKEGGDFRGQEVVDPSVHPPGELYAVPSSVDLTIPCFRVPARFREADPARNERLKLAQA